MNWVLGLALLVPLLAAVLSAAGLYRHREQVLGIDLGTTMSVVGVRDGFGDGVRIVADAAGERLVPSAVAFAADGSVAAVGAAARAQQARNPGRTVVHAKRFIGRAADDPAVRALAVPFPVVAGEGGRAAFAVARPPVLPEEVGAHVVRRLVAMADAALGHSQARTAVVAVPANFGPAQREATRRAFELAGLRVKHVLEEPTAAAMAYGLHERASVHNVVVFDLGGGTLDVSLLLVSAGAVEVAASEGDDELGGADFDACVGGLLPAGSACELDELRLAKEALTGAAAVPVACAGPGARLTREAFEEGCAGLRARALAVVRRLLEGASLAPAEVDEVVLVGGSTRMPWVARDLEALFGKRPHDKIDPDVAVAWGCASVL